METVTEIERAPNQPAKKFPEKFIDKRHYDARVSNSQ